MIQEDRDLPVATFTNLSLHNSENRISKLIIAFYEAIESCFKTFDNRSIIIRYDLTKHPMR